ncbi:MAG: flagellar filament capping protein FliD [Bacteriovoracaceae bacterium]
MGISFGSISTGLPKDIVKQLVEAEKIPIQQMEARKSKIEDKKKLLNELIGLVEGIRGDIAKNGTSMSLKELKVDTNNEIVGVAVDKTKAKPGSYQLEVLEMANKSSGMSNGFADKDESYIGVGYIQYELPDGETKEIYVDPENSSLQKISELINKDSKIGMRASVINDGSGSDTPFHLVLSLEGTGDASAAKFPYFYFVDGDEDFFIESEREGKDAKVKLDGFEVELPANKSSELVPGLTIDLKKAKPGEEFSINVKEDKEAVTTKITDLISKINAVFSFIHKQNKLDEKSDTSRTLGGDLTLQTLESRMRTALLTPVMTEVGPRRLSEIGLSFGRDGTLNWDQKKFESSIAENYGVVSQVLTGYFPETGEKHDGALTNLNNVVNQVLRRPDGVLNSRKAGLQSNQDQIDRQISNRMRIIEQKEKNLKDKFSRLEGTISKIRNQGNGLAGMAQMAQVQQLG